MCAAILPLLFKLNDQIKFDEAIDNIVHEMFVHVSEVLDDEIITNTKRCALTFNTAINPAKDLASKISAFSDKIQENERLNFNEDPQSTLKHIALAVDFINNCTNSETLKPFRDIDWIKREDVVVTATRNKSLFEIFVSIQYASIAAKGITVVLDPKREYLKELLLSVFEAEAESIDDDYSVISSAEASTFCTQIIFDSADCQSAFNVLATAFDETTSPWKIRSCWIQDTLKAKFLNCFKSLILPTAKHLDNVQKAASLNTLDNARRLGATIFQSEDRNAAFVVDLTRKHVDSIECVAVNFFRTPKEVVSLVHAIDQTNCASIWSESISLAYDVADKLNVENIWINSNGLLHPEIPFIFGVPANKQIYGSKLGVAQMLNFPKRPFVGNKPPSYSTAKTVAGKYNFQTTSRVKKIPFIFDNSINRVVDAELTYSIDVSEANNLKTICFPFGQIFGN